MNRILQNVLVFVLPVFSVLPLSAEQASAADRVPLPAVWRWSFSDDPAAVGLSYDDRSWSTVELPAVADHELHRGSRTAWLRGRFLVPDSMRGERLYLLAGRMDGALEFYVNGILLYAHGSFGAQGGRYHTYTPKQFIVPSELLDPDRENLISVRMRTAQGLFAFPQIVLGTPESYEFDLYTLGFFNNAMYVIFSVLSLFISLFFLIQYAGDTGKRSNLYYAAANLCFAIYFFEMGYEHPLLPMLLGRRIGKAMLVPAVSFLTVFFIDYLRNSKPVRGTGPILGAGAVCGALYLVPRDLRQIETLFTILLIPIVAAIILMVVLSIRGVRKRHPDAPPLIAGVTIAVLCSAQDVVCQFAGIDPFVWLQGVGIFILNFSMFVSLSLRAIRTDHSLRRYTREALEKTERLETFVNRIGLVSNETSEASAELLQDIEVMSALMAKNGRLSGDIASSADTQSVTVERTVQTVIELLSSVEEVFDKLEVQSGHVQEISSTLEEMLANIGSITGNLESTAEFTVNLGKVTEEGRRAVEVSNEAMGKIQRLSGSIFEIIGAVDDLAERTNLLAINAAIEAANAGSAGRGFAVVAGEIKQLSRASGEQVRKIGDHVSGINESITLGVEVNAEVRRLLTEINEKTRLAVDRVQSAYGAIREQHEASGSVLESAGRLRDTAEELRLQAGAQRESGRSIRGRVEELSQISDAVRASILEIAKENEKLRDLVKHVGTVSARSDASVKTLLSLIGARTV